MKLPPGFDPSVTFMAHLWEPLRVIPLPLALHVLSEAMHLVCRSLLALAGFSVHYMHVRPPRSSSVSAQPGCLHGIFISGIALKVLCG